MDLQYLCTNCLTGTVRNGTCTYCHKSVNEASKQPANALPVRYMLGSQYYLGKVIGNGGFGITYLAWDCIEQRRVIVKELYPRQDVQRDPASKMVVPLKGQEDYFRKLKHRFKEEAQILYSFRHEPSVMNVYRLMEDNNTVYYSMEYLSGFDLKTYMEQQGKLGWPQLSGYIRKILYTLHILHGQNLIHRDISPDNIFLTSVTDAKLIDFGSVRNYNSGQGLTTILKSGRRTASRAWRRWRRRCFRVRNYLSRRNSTLQGGTGRRKNRTKAPRQEMNRGLIPVPSGVRRGYFQGAGSAFHRGTACPSDGTGSAALTIP